MQANDSSLPNNYFRAEKPYILFKTPAHVVERLRYKYSDPAWYCAKLRRIPAETKGKL